MYVKKLKTFLPQTNFSGKNLNSRRLARRVEGRKPEIAAEAQRKTYLFEYKYLIVLICMAAQK